MNFIGLGLLICFPLTDSYTEWPKKIAPAIYFRIIFDQNEQKITNSIQSNSDLLVTILVLLHYTPEINNI